MAIYKYSYLALILFTFISLSGSIYGINVKLLLTAIVGLSLFFILLKYEFRVYKINILLTIIFLTIITCALAIGFNNYTVPQNYAIKEYIGFLSPLIILALFNKDSVTINSVKNTMLLGAIVFSSCKLISVILISVDVVNFLDFYDFLESLFGYRIVSMHINPEYNIVRIYVINDLLIAISPILLFGKNKLAVSEVNRVLILVIFSLSMFISYSRFLIIVFILTIIISAIVETQLKITLKKALLSHIGICLIFSSIVFYGLPDSIIKRFSSASVANVSSDAVRSEQFNAVFEMINDHLIFGSGLGSSNWDYRAGYVYELQWLSFGFKLGLPLLSILFTVILIFFRSNYNITPKSTLIIVIVLSSSLFNPYLQSTVMGACILMIFTKFNKEATHNKIRLLRH